MSNITKELGAGAPRNWRRSGGDKSRRGRWLDLVSTASISRGCRAWALALATRSSTTAKPVWGYQTGQAEAIGCSARQVRRYRCELERAGLIETERGQVHRHSDGRYSQQMTNRYRFVVPPRPTRYKPSSDRAVTGDRLNPIPTGWLETLRSDSIQEVDPDPAPPPWRFDRGHFGAARRALGRHD